MGVNNHLLTGMILQESYPLSTSSGCAASTPNGNLRSSRSAVVQKEIGEDLDLAKDEK